MHIVDIVLLVLFLVAMIWGFKKGFITALLLWIGLFTTMLMIARFGPMVQAGLMIKFSLGGFFAGVIAYLLIFVLICVLFAILNILLNYLAKLLNLTFVNRVIGSVFGFLNMAIILVLFLLLMDFFPFFPKFNAYLGNSVVITETHKIKDLAKTDIREKLPAEFFK